MERCILGDRYVRRGGGAEGACTDGGLCAVGVTGVTGALVMSREGAVGESARQRSAEERRGAQRCAEERRGVAGVVGDW